MTLCGIIHHGLTYTEAKNKLLDELKVLGVVNWKEYAHSPRIAEDLSGIPYPEGLDHEHKDIKIWKAFNEWSVGAKWEEPNELSLSQLIKICVNVYSELGYTPMQPGVRERLREIQSLARRAIYVGEMVKTPNDDAPHP